MSLLNVWVSPTRALLAVDTDAEMTGGMRISISKVVPLPAHRMVLACRGDLILFNQLVAFVHGSGGGVDELRHSIPVMADHLVTQLEAMHNGQYRFREAEFALLGWSEADQCIRGFAIVRMPSDAAFQVSAIEPWRIGPNADWKHLPPPPDCAETMEALARDQVRYMRAHHPDAPIGGRLLLAEIETTAIGVRELAAL